MRNATSQNTEADAAGPFAALQNEILPAPSPLRAAIAAAHRCDEQAALRSLLAQSDTAAQPAIRSLARQLVQAVRTQRARASGVGALMQEFSLSSEEGVALMCLAEALLRIPDRQTADRLIADKIGHGDWRRHLGESPSVFVNAAVWGLLVTGRLVGARNGHDLGSALTRLIAKGGEPLIRKGVDLAMRMLGNQFVTGQTIGQALRHSRANEARGYRYSYDMLGEAALTEAEAAHYCAAYETAIHAIGRAANGRGIRNGPGISVKLSALHPRYSRAQRARVMHELLPRLKRLALLARQYGIGLNIDAEEADRLELSLDLLEALAFDADLAGFDGIGFVAQAYQKRCPFVLDYLADLARRSGRKLMVRLVKGAYWDTEIKRAQVDGMPGYPVYTRKVHTDISYLACAQKLLAATDVIYPQFATHNAHSVAAIHTWAQQRGVTDYEFQCLHGMGEPLYDQLVGRPLTASGATLRCRIYAPVGSHRTLLAYLVRRLLENGANSSFVNRIADATVAIDALIADPFDALQKHQGAPHPAIPLPADLYGAGRRNAAGVDLSDENALRDLGAAFNRFGCRQWQAAPLLDGAVSAVQIQPVCNPADRREQVGHVTQADATDIDAALAAASAYATVWQAMPPAARADRLMQAADLYEAHRPELMALLIREAGKTLPNALAEVREAVDFIRYYAAQVRHADHAPALGPVLCISPWNFPLAIFTGQISAPLAAGNVVLAKPAEQTPLVAYRAVQLLHAAGIPRAALQFLPGRGETVGAALTADPRVCGVLFTGSLEVAQRINRTLAQRAAATACDLPLIAETGGQNAMIVDSSALPEQVVQDVIGSAFDSAGQRCSALRVLCLQTDIADRILTLLRGAMQQLHIGKPDRLAIDIGPVIDQEAQQSLLAHIDRLKPHAGSVYQLPLPLGLAHGSFVAPTVLEIGALSELTHEVFGPVLHVVRYRRERLPQLVDAINASGYGLTLGIHSRIDETIDFIVARAQAGNIYVNRSMVGAVVGVQPFGGTGKSGTGPKSGGPLYLKRLQRAPDDQAAAHAVPTHPAAALPLDALLAWSTQHGYRQAAALGAHYSRSTPLGASLSLPGPTGERNTLSFSARGLVLCAATSVAALLNQLAAVLATGNTPAVAATTAALIPADLPPLVRKLIVPLVRPDDGAHALRLALAEPSEAPALWPLLAARDGALVPLVLAAAQTAIPLWRLVTERTLCVDTTAAGGNASLMTLEE